MKRILVLLLVITGLYIAFNSSFNFNWFSSAATKDTQSADISNDTKEIVIDVGSGNTKIVPEDRDDVKAVYNGKGKLSVTENGSSVEVTLKSNWFDWFDWSSGPKHKTLTIYIPKDYRQDMSINLGSGNFNFSGKNSKLDALSLEIGSGNLELSNLHVNKFTLNGSSGNIKVNKLKTKKGKIDLSSGNINLNHYSGALKADVSSGRLKVQMDRLTDSIDIEVSSGIVGLDLPDNADFTLNSDVSSGRISCGFPLKSKNVSNKNINGTHGSGKHEINVSVSSGLVNIH